MSSENDDFTITELDAYLLGSDLRSLASAAASDLHGTGILTNDVASEDERVEKGVMKTNWERETMMKMIWEILGEGPTIRRWKMRTILR